MKLTSVFRPCRIKYVSLSTTGKAHPSDAVSIELSLDAARASRLRKLCFSIRLPARLTRQMPWVLNSRWMPARASRPHNFTLPSYIQRGLPIRCREYRSPVRCRREPPGRANLDFSVWLPAKLIRLMPRVLNSRWMWQEPSEYVFLSTTADAYPLVPWVLNSRRTLQQPPVKQILAFQSVYQQVLPVRWRESWSPVRCRWESPGHPSLPFCPTVSEAQPSDAMGLVLPPNTVRTLSAKPQIFSPRPARHTRLMSWVLISRQMSARVLPAGLLYLPPASETYPSDAVSSRRMLLESSLPDVPNSFYLPSR